MYSTKAKANLDSGVCCSKSIYDPLNATSLSLIDKLLTHMEKQAYIYIINNSQV